MILHYDQLASRVLQPKQQPPSPKWSPKREGYKQQQNVPESPRRIRRWTYSPKLDEGSIPARSPSRLIEVHMARDAEVNCKLQELNQCIKALQGAVPDKDEGLGFNITHLLEPTSYKNSFQAF